MSGLVAPIIAVHAQDAKLKNAIDNAIQLMVKHIKATDINEYNVGLAAYTLIKANVPVDDPAVQKYLKEVLERCSGEKYQLTHPSSYYMAATDAMALEAIDPKKYQQELQNIADFFIQGQRKHGGWFYYGKNSKEEATLGDTSITQYAILGLWACQRAGIDIPQDVWNKALSWLLATQLANGGGAYQHSWPPSKTAEERPTMSVANCSSIGIVALNLYGTDLQKVGNQKLQTQGGAKFGVLEKRGEQAKKESASLALIQPEVVKKSVTLSAKWLNGRHTSNERSHKRWYYYYLYGIERTAAIHDFKILNGEDWYVVGSKSILQTLNKDGSLKRATSGAEQSSVCFAILFLTRSTGKLLKRERSGYNAGAGLLAGGRGLPDDLKAVELKDGDVNVRKSLGSLDELLANLEKSNANEFDLVGTQKELVEKIQLEDREQLIGQRDRLLKLVMNKDPDIRRTALWALARCARLEDSKLIFSALTDTQKRILKDEDAVDLAEVAVAIEARNALCWLSRKPLGVIKEIDGVRSPQDPYDLLPVGTEAESATRDQVIAATKTWLSHIVPAWKKWYLQNRPYELRDEIGEPGK